MSEQSTRSVSNNPQKKEKVMSKLTSVEQTLFSPISQCLLSLHDAVLAEEAMVRYQDAFTCLAVEIEEKDATIKERKAVLLAEISGFADVGDIAGLRQRMAELDSLSSPQSAKSGNNAQVLSDWQQFFKDVFNRHEDLSTINVPTDSGGFGWIIYNLPNLSLSLLYAKCRERFDGNFWSYTDDPDTDIPYHDRDPNRTGAYSVRCRDRAEADEENKNLSVKQLAKKKILGLTLPERILLELFHHWKTGQHLDIKYWTFCSGSRRSVGGVPYASCHDGRFSVDYVVSFFAFGALRARSAVV